MKNSFSLFIFTLVALLQLAQVLDANPMKRTMSTDDLSHSDSWNKKARPSENLTNEISFPVSDNSIPTSSIIPTAELATESFDEYIQKEPKDLDENGWVEHMKGATFEIEHRFSEVLVQLRDCSLKILPQSKNNIEQLVEALNDIVKKAQSTWKSFIVLPDSYSKELTPNEKTTFSTKLRTCRNEYEALFNESKRFLDEYKNAPIVLQPGSVSGLEKEVERAEKLIAQEEKYLRY